MSVKLEHANLCVRDIEAMIHFLQTALPEFRVQGEGISNDWTRWVHVGTDDTYIAWVNRGWILRNTGRHIRGCRA